MKTIKVRGLVIREYDAGESDKRLVIFCKGQGRLLVYARGARKPTSRFMAAAQLFTYADFVLAQGRGFYSLAQAQVIESFFSLREDYDRLMSAHLMAEVCEKTLWENIESDELLRLSLKSLSVLAKGKTLPALVSVVFLFRFFDVHGLRPQVESCTICDTPAAEITHAILTAEGLTCKEHGQVGQYSQISHAGILAIQHILDNNTAQAFQFTLRDDILRELVNAADMFWRLHFEHKLVVTI